MGIKFQNNPYALQGIDGSSGSSRSSSSSVLSSMQIEPLVKVLFCVCFAVFASSEPVPGFQGDTLQLAFIDLRQVMAPSHLLSAVLYDIWLAFRQHDTAISSSGSSECHCSTFCVVP